MSPRTPNDLLLDRERVRGASRMLPEGTRPEAVTEDQARQVAHDVETYIKTHRIPQREVARALGVSPSVISEVLRGTYAGDWRQISVDLDAWLEDQQRRDAKPRTTQFVWTRVARQIQMLANLAAQTGSIALIYGPESSGMGKTTTLRAIERERPGSIYVSVEKIHANPTGLLRAIAQALHVNDARSNRALYDRIVGLLRGTPRLLMVDQIHSLRGSKGDKPLYILADLYDATGAPQLWVGTADMEDYLRRGQSRGDEPLAQIRSRIQIRYDLADLAVGDGGGDHPLYSVDEIRQVFGSNKLRLTTGAARFICELANATDNGALRTAANVVLLATIVAEQARETEISEVRVREAHRLTLSRHKYQTATARLDDARGDVAARRTA